MRILPPSLAFVLLAAPALAGSIDPIVGATGAGSIETIRCADCPALKPKLKSSAYHVDAIAPGTQKVEIREVNGERRIYRTEAWMGGSPVLFVNKAPAEAVEAADAEKPVEANTIDTSARTSALEAGAASREFDPAKLELRLN